MKITINYQECNQRLDKYVKKLLCNAPLSLIYRFLRMNKIKVNNKKVPISYILNEGDELTFFISEEQFEELSKRNKHKIKKAIQIIYESDQLLVVNKLAGTEVQQKGSILSMVDIVQTFIDERDDNNKFIAPCHRLDVNTTGVLIFAKTVNAAQKMQEMFKNRQIEKKYIALVAGLPKEKGVVTSYLQKNNKLNKVFVVNQKDGKEAILSYRVIEYFESSSLLEIQLHTGRTHQIRVQLASINHPLIGDGKYGDFKLNRQIAQNFNFQNYFLHASEIVLICPFTKEKLILKAPIPQKMSKFLENLRRKS